MIGQVVAVAAERFADANCYVSPDGWALTYRELHLRSDEVAVALSKRGIGEGDVVTLVLPSIPEYFVAYAALAKLGAITAGVNARLTPPERAAVLELAAPALVLATSDLAPIVGDAPVVEVEPATSSDGVFRALRAGSENEAPPPLRPDAERAVAIIFTSGTTGTPKGAVFADRQLDFITNVDTDGQWADAPGTPTFTATSFAHLGPMTKFPGTLMRGGATYLQQRWRAADSLRMIAEHRMVGIGGIPTQVALMLQEPDFDAYDLSSLRAVVMGGGPATPALVREARERFAAAVAIRYSCTEAGIGIGTAFDDPPEDAEESVGRPLPGVELTLRGEDGEPVTPGEVGEVELRSPAVMSGYWRDAAGTSEAMTAAGAVRTGDLGWLDDAGRLHLVGRSKEMYVRGGYNVYPMEVEAVLATHPDIAEVAVVPRPDDVMGEVGVAVLVLRGGAATPALDDLRAYGADWLANYKLPDEVRIVDAMPLTAMEKIDRRALRTRIA